MASMLYAIEIPSKGGNTLFANAYMAYETLPVDLKRRIQGQVSPPPVAQLQRLVDRGLREPGQRRVLAHTSPVVKQPAPGELTRILDDRIGVMDDPANDQLQRARQVPVEAGHIGDPRLIGDHVNLRVIEAK